MGLFNEYFAPGFNDLLIQFGELIDYVPRTGARRNGLCAIVNRSPDAVEIAGEILLPSLTIDVFNNTEHGILHDEYDQGDQVEVVVRVGGEKVLKAFTIIENTDGAVLTLAVY